MRISKTIMGCVLSIVFCCSSRLQAGIDITLNLTGFTTSQTLLFEQAESFWENALAGYQPGITLTGPIITGNSAVIDGVGGILGSAGPTGTTAQGGFVLATSGVMNFDTADLANLESQGRFLPVIQHEMAHVLGFGTLWTNNDVYINNSGQFTGTNALLEWQTEFGQAADSFVPVELGGQPGTRNGHWDEVDGGAGLVGITDGLGRDMRDELMTGWLNNETFVSRMTLASFEDIGFVANYSAVPEPSSLILLAMFGTLACARIRRSAR